MTKKEAEKAIDALIKQSKDVIEQAMKIADEHGLDFRYEPDHLGTYYGAGSEDHPYADGGVSGEGEWYPSSWSSSSIYC